MKEEKATDEYFDLVQTKVPKHIKQLIDILAAQRGLSSYELLQLLINGFITAAKASGPLSPELKTIIEAIKIDSSWRNAFSFTGISSTTEIEQAILVLRQKDIHGHPKDGYGIAMIDRPFCGDTTMTVCVDDIFERVVKVSMPGLYKRLDKVGKRLFCNSMRETLTLLAELMNDSLDKEEERAEMPGYGEHHDFGKKIEYGNKSKQFPHRTPDSLANSQLHIVFDEFDREVADMEVQDWEGEHRQTDFDTPSNRDIIDELSKGHALDDDLESEMGFRPFTNEW